MVNNDLKIWLNNLLPNPFHMVDIIIDGIAVDFEIFIVVVWFLEVDASGSPFMICSVHPCWEELWSFLDELLVNGYLVVSCSLVLNDRGFYSNCKSFQYNLNFVECYYFIKIYFHMVYFDFGTVLSWSFYTVLDSIVYHYCY